MLILQIDISWAYRIKSLASCLIKYDRYAPNYAVERVYNDILGFRVIVESYDNIQEIGSASRISDMRRGKKIDDGYRGMHVYYQKDHFHYPVEVQYNTYKDRWPNDMLHKHLYKKNISASIGASLRESYEKGNIKDAESFRRDLNVLLDCQ